LNPVESYIFEKTENERAILTFFHDLFINKYQLTGAIKWKIPTYYGKSWILYMNPDKKEGIHLCFVRGNELSNSSGILESKGRKMVLSYHIKNIEEIPFEALIISIEEAILLDKTIPFTMKKSNKL